MEMAQPATGDEKNVTSKAINTDGLNYDSDQAIMGATQVQDGKWRFFEAGKLIAEADAPPEKTREILESWCRAVRARTKRELTGDDQTARDANRSRTQAEKLDAGGIVGVDGQQLSSSDTPVDPVVESVEAEDSSPDDWLNSKIQAAQRKIDGIIGKKEELEELLGELRKEFDKAEADLVKWNRLKGAMDED